MHVVIIFPTHNPPDFSCTNRSSSPREKAGAGGAPASLDCPLAKAGLKLEVELQSELKFACSLSAGDLAERRVGSGPLLSDRVLRPCARIERTPRRSTTEVPHRMIEGIQCLKAEFQPL